MIRKHYPHEFIDGPLCQSVPDCMASLTDDKEKVTCRRCLKLLEDANGR